VRNKARLVDQDFSQVEGLDFRKIFTHVARIETIRIQEEVFVRQPPGFENPKYPNGVYKLSKVFYELKQAPRA
jgi:hypothetical protein